MSSFETRKSLILKSLSGISTISSPIKILQESSSESFESPENLAAAVADKMSRDEHDDDEAYITFRVPKYFQALFTLFVCFLILFCTLSIIRQTKKFCKRSGCTRRVPLLRVDSDKNADGQQCIVAPNNAAANSNGGRDANNDDKPLAYSPNSSTKEKEEDLLKLKKVRFVRKLSGPFGEEALNFVGQTYKSKCKEVEQEGKVGKVQGKYKNHQSMKKQSKLQAPGVPSPNASPIP